MVDNILKSSDLRHPLIFISAGNHVRFAEES